MPSEEAQGVQMNATVPQAESQSDASSLNNRLDSISLSSVPPAATPSSSSPSSSSKPSKPAKSSKSPHPKSPASQPPLTQLSRALSYLLRHGAEKEKLPIRPDGFIPISECLKRSRVKQIDMEPDNGQFTKDGKKKRKEPKLEDVRRVVEDVAPGEKKRFEMREIDGNWFVRAIQGHTIESVKELDHVAVTLQNLDVLALPAAKTDRKSATSPQEEGEPRLPPGVEILHGTTEPAWDLIKQSGGLSRMKRNHIHLARARPGVEGVGSGMRPNSPLLIHIDLINALRDGVPFHLASNGALLTAGVDEKGVLALKYVIKVEKRQGEVVWERE